MFINFSFPLDFLSGPLQTYMPPQAMKNSADRSLKNRQNFPKHHWN
jgi:hypothetical protein